MQLPRRLALFITVTVTAGLTPRAALAESPPAHEFSLTPHLGVTSESAFVDGAVRFSNVDVDFVSIVPDTGLLLGVELGYRFRPNLTGVLALSFARANARYIERDKVRTDATIDTIRIQPGVMIDVISAGATDVSLGGGLTIAQISIDDLIWKDVRFGSSALAIGVYGAGGLDIAISERASFHAHLALEVTRPTYGDLESDLALRDKELGAEVDHDLRLAALLVIGVTFGL